METIGRDQAAQIRQHRRRLVSGIDERNDLSFIDRERA